MSFFRQAAVKASIANIDVTKALDALNLFDGKNSTEKAIVIASTAVGAYLGSYVSNASLTMTIAGGVVGLIAPHLYIIPKAIYDRRNMEAEVERRKSEILGLSNDSNRGDIEHRLKEIDAIDFSNEKDANLSATLAQKLSELTELKGCVEANTLGRPVIKM